MILRPCNPLPPLISNFVPAWDAVLRSQKQQATEWQLIAQADHAALAGEMAGKVAKPDFPKLEPEIIQAIAVHDEGWKGIDERAKKPGRPLSFFEETPAQIFEAWKGSIATATQISPTAGILVSEHFCRIARDFSRAATTPPEVAQVLTTFVEREIAQQEDLRERQSRDAKEIYLLVDVLQFFDLLSLYVCCGSQDNVEFPQRFNGTNFRMHCKAGKYRLEPPIFEAPVNFSIKAMTYPAQNGEATQISVVLS